MLLVTKTYHKEVSTIASGLAIAGLILGLFLAAACMWPRAELALERVLLLTR